MLSIGVVVLLGMAVGFFSPVLGEVVSLLVLAGLGARWTWWHARFLELYADAGAPAPADAGVACGGDLR